MEMILKAFVNEENCIGCMKCIRICPTDAIVGAKKMLHTILPDLCTACESCIGACPTDCITLATEWEKMTETQELFLTNKKQARLGAFGFSFSVMQQNNHQVHQPNLESPVASAQIDRKQQIADAIARVQQRKKQI